MQKTLFLILLFPFLLLAQPLYHFENVSLNYNDWLQHTQDVTSKEDFTYIGFEGGAGWNSAEVYGFLNVENPLDDYGEDDTQEALRLSGLIDVDYVIDGGWRFHLQDYMLHSSSFYVNDAVVGVGYKFMSDFGLWFRPFIGVHHTYSSYYNDLNGYMTGWLFNYETTLYGKKIVLFNWHEIEFGRKKSFYLNDAGERVGDGASWGVNGALSFWYYLQDEIVLGVQYRYANHKLGSYEMQSALIYTVKYYF